MNVKRYVWIGWLPVFIWGGWIFWMSSQSNVPEPGIWLPPHFDKLVHALIYGILSCLIYPFMRSAGLNRIHAAVVSVVSASLYGVTDEWHQSMVANRMSDIYDWIADTIGACIVFLVARHEERILSKFSRKI